MDTGLFTQLPLRSNARCMLKRAVPHVLEGTRKGVARPRLVVVEIDMAGSGQLEPPIVSE